MIQFDIIVFPSGSIRIPTKIDFSMSSEMSSYCRLPSIYDQNDQIHTRFPIDGQSIPILYAWSWLETGLRFQ